MAKHTFGPLLTFLFFTRHSAANVDSKVTATEASADDIDNVDNPELNESYATCKKESKNCANKTGSKTVAKSDDVENEAELHPVDRTTDNADTYVKEFLLAQQPYSEGRRACQHWWAACGGEGCVRGDGLQEGVHLGLAEDLLI